MHQHIVTNHAPLHCPADVVMVNSSWTAGHVQQLWWRWRAPCLVFPPCDTSDLQRLPLDRRLKHLFLVSVAQFRPEKNHRLQLEAYALARQWAGAHLGGLVAAWRSRGLACSHASACAAAALGSSRRHDPALRAELQSLCTLFLTS